MVYIIKNPNKLRSFDRAGRMAEANRPKPSPNPKAYQDMQIILEKAKRGIRL